MVVPEGKTFLVYPNMFNGPCKPSSITITVAGTIIAPDTTDKWKGIDASLWIGFNNVNGVTVNGNGNFNGRGLNWWNQSCALSHYKPALKFLGCQDIRIDNVKFQDSPQTHILLMGCQRVNITNVYINSPGFSPNTDGIHIHESQHIYIDKAVIESDLTGTSATPVAIKLNCSNTVSCDGLTFDTIQISSASKGQKVTAACNHASGKTDGTIDPPLSCLSHA
ncbi:Polygalacturonase-2 [Acorus calamus]|uniref:Polygalacturonase-2 n=1 Tax=Acorus calamus TaxID=4465 RepID=A0AAV9C3F6_ACOCL|nr:Polygalacturonase-2 [Acorus calamus]